MNILTRVQLLPLISKWNDVWTDRVDWCAKTTFVGLAATVPSVLQSRLCTVHSPADCSLPGLVIPVMEALLFHTRHCCEWLGRCGEYVHKLLKSEGSLNIVIYVLILSLGETYRIALAMWAAINCHHNNSCTACTAGLREMQYQDAPGSQ